MKKKFILPILLCNLPLFAQFTIDGQFENYNQKKVLVKLYENSEVKLVQNVITDNAGKFSAKVPKEYHGFVKIDLPTGESLSLLTDNRPLKFITTAGQSFLTDLQIIEGKAHQEYQANDLKKSLADVNQNVFPYLKSIYKPGDKFYQAILMEEQRIKTVLVENTSPSKLVQYNLNLQSILTEAQTGKDPELKGKILSHLVNDDDRLEQSGQLQNLLYAYINLELNGGSDSSTPIEEKLMSMTEKLLAETDIQTSRGQAVLGSLLNLIPAQQFANYHATYLKKIEGLTCKLTTDLTKKINGNKVNTIGNTVPNIVFEQAVQGKKNLYDIKADKKLIVFWASWCPACINELPYIKDFYTSFKKQGGEIIAISLDYDPQAYQKAIKDMPWLNYSDLMRWDSPTVDLFGVTSTPTLFLVDKNNKLIKKVNHVSELITDEK